MAICHLRTSVGSASRGQSATSKHDYITREGKYGRDADEVEHVEHGNMPEWAAEDGRGYWQAADAGERANGRLFVEVQVALPNELDHSQQRELARVFARQLTEGERLPYTVAVHRGESKDPSKPDNPHAHIVLSERRNDGVPRAADTWFRRANRQHPERGGAAKVSHLQAREWPERIRQGWSSECNRALERAGRAERIDPRTLAEQAREALKKGDVDRAAELSRAPEPKRGAGDAIQRRYEQGKAPGPSRSVAAWKRTKAANDKWRKECRQRSEKAQWSRRALAAAERVVPASEEERAIGRAAGKAIGRGLAQARRKDGERPERSPGKDRSKSRPASRKPAAPPGEPNLWERYRESRKQKRSEDSRKKFDKQATARGSKQLDRGAAPWQKGWKKPTGANEPPTNPVTGQRYQDLNAIVLRCEAVERGYHDPRWLTNEQAREIGAEVREGERGTQIESQQVPSKEEASSKDAQAGAEQGTPQIPHRTYTVFNAEQINNMPGREYKWVAGWEASERAERLLQESGARIEHEHGNQAFYHPKDDKIVLPEREQFPTNEGYYATALHEMAHWTGHKDRLDRETHRESLNPETGGSGSAAYAKEELRAEMTSMIVNGELGLPHDPTRHASYAGAWIQALKDDPNELRQAARDADSMAKYILQYDRPRPQDIDPPSRQVDYSSPMPERPRSVEQELGRSRSRDDDLGRSR